MPFTKHQSHDVYYVWKPSAQGSNGTTLVLVHGLGSSNSFYAPIIPYLVEQGISCLAFDTPGSGLSSYTGQVKTPKDIAEVAFHLLTMLEIDFSRAVFVGHSMGAIVATEAALLHSLRGVVLLGPVHPTETLAGIFETRIQNVKKNGMEVLADTIPTAATGQSSTTIHHAFIRALLLSQPSKGYTSLCETIATATAPKYELAKCPLLLIAGADDKTSPMDGCRTILNEWGRGSNSTMLECLDGVGHWHCIEAGDKVMELVGNFVKGL